MTGNFQWDDRIREYKENYFTLIIKIFNSKNKDLNISIVKKKKKSKLGESKDLNLLRFKSFSLKQSLFLAKVEDGFPPQIHLLEEKLVTVSYLKGDWKLPMTR